MPCSGFFIKAPWHFCQHRVMIALHRLIVCTRAARALQQRRGKAQKYLVFPDTRLREGLAPLRTCLLHCWLQLPCMRQPCSAPLSTRVSSHLPGLGVKKPFLSLVCQSLIIPLAAGVQTGSLILLLSCYFFAQKARKMSKKSEAPPIFILIGIESSELSSSLSIDLGQLCWDHSEHNNNDDDKKYKYIMVSCMCI